MKPNLHGVRFKFVRANEHLEAIVRMLGRFSYGECDIVRENDPKDNLLILRVRLPKVPDPLGPMIGDFLFNVRSALDHIVWQLVLSNPIASKPTGKNAFPICSTPENFKDAVARRHRLDGVPPKAAALIEALQPYEGRENPLATLDNLHNIDKHQRLSLITAVASDAALDWSKGFDPLCRMLISNYELRDGTVFGDIGISLAAGQFSARLENMEVKGKATIFVAFNDPAAESLKSLQIETVLEEILQFVRYDVIAVFEPFLD